MKRILFTSVVITMIAISTYSQSTGTFTDHRDGKIYKTVKIGKQTWMAENLNFKTSSGSWVYKNDPSNEIIYGRLYDWETAQKVCPVGWHLPTIEEWHELIIFLGGKSIAGSKLKEEGTAHWKSPNKGATNESGFSGLPGGYRNQNKGFHSIGSYGQWWSSTIQEGIGIQYMSLSNKNTRFSQHRGLVGYGFDKVGLSVRCVRD
jgi:uncharacterized protein (TIGR02145 family)